MAQPLSCKHGPSCFKHVAPLHAAHGAPTQLVNILTAAAKDNGNGNGNGGNGGSPGNSGDGSGDGAPAQTLDCQNVLPQLPAGYLEVLGSKTASSLSIMCADGYVPAKFQKLGCYSECQGHGLAPVAHCLGFCLRQEIWQQGYQASCGRELLAVQSCKRGAKRL